MEAYTLCGAIIVIQLSIVLLRVVEESVRRMGCVKRAVYTKPVIREVCVGKGRDYIGRCEENGLFSWQRRESVPSVQETMDHG